MKLRITSVVLALIMILSLAPCALAETVAEGDCGDSATWTLDDAGTLTISGTGSVWSSKFWQNDAIKKVVVGEGVTELYSSFRYDENLTEVSLPSSLTRLSLGAFDGCIALKKLTIPAGVTELGMSEGQQLFIEEFTVDAANTEYKSVDGAILSKDGDTLIVYPPAKVGESYAVPEGVVMVGTCAFSNAGNLTTVSLPASVRVVNGSFYNCENLENILVDKNSERLTSVDGVLYSKDMTILYRHPAKNSSGFNVPDTVNEIWSYAFEGADITEFHGGENILSMDIGVFENCVSLTSFSAEGPIPRIERRCFKNCKKLDKVTLPDTVESIGEEAFYNCYGITDIKLPAMLSIIDEYAFKDCDSIQTVVCPDKLRVIGYGAFEKCTDLTAIYLPKSIENIEDEFESTLLSDIYYDGTENEWSFVTCDYDLTYKIRRGDITVHFMAKPSINGDITYLDGVVTVPLSETSLDCTLVVAAYKDNALISINSKPLEKGAVSDTISIDTAGSDRIVVYIWDSMKCLAPMCKSASIPYAGTISGQVKSGTDVISGASLGLYDSSNKLIAKTESDENGNFTFENVPAGGGYRISAGKTDYIVSMVKNIYVEAGKCVMLDVFLALGDRVA